VGNTAVAKEVPKTTTGIVIILLDNSNEAIDPATRELAIAVYAISII
jgi:hypothetical protein